MRSWQLKNNEFEGSRGVQLTRQPGEPLGLFKMEMEGLVEASKSEVCLLMRSKELGK